MITSKDNPKIKYILKLHSKKYRDQYNQFLVFGDHQIDEAIKQGYKLDFYTSNPIKKGEQISEQLMKLVCMTETPQDIFGIADKKSEAPYSNKILMLDNIQDPGNMGTLIRSAVGFGFQTVIASLNAVDFYHERSIRATQGNLFHANLIKAPLTDRIKALKFLGYKIYATDLKRAQSIKDVQPSEKMVLILGNEGSGVSESLLALSDYKVMIRTRDIESLNVAMAGSIIMYEWGDV